jgi:hypothetical protein
MNFIKIRVFFLILIFIFLLSLPLYAESLSFRLDQSKIKLSIPPGGSQAGEVKVYSQSDEVINLKVYLEDWVYSNTLDGSKDFSPAGSNANSCAPWINFNPTEFKLPAYGVTTINYIVNVPKTAAGGYYAVMFFETAFDQAKNSELTGQNEVKSGVGLAIRLGSLFYLEAKDTLKRSAELSNFFVMKEEKNKYLSISCDFENVGNTYITVAGSFHIMDKQSLVRARGEFNEGYTFPQDKVMLKAVWKNPIPQGKYDLVITLDLGKAQQEANLSRGPILVKETNIEIGADGEVVRVGELQ